MKNHVAATLAATLVALPLPAQGQSLAQHRGFWFGLGAGAGLANTSCGQCVNASDLEGGTGYFKLGGTVTPRFRIGVEIRGWRGSSATLGDVTASAYYYPSVARGLFLTGGLGVSHYSGGATSRSVCDLQICKGDTYQTCDLAAGSGYYGYCTVPRVSGFGGLALVGGAGFDIPVASQTSLSLVLTYSHSGPGHLATQGSFSNGSTSATAWRQHVVALAMGVTYQ